MSSVSSSEENPVTLRPEPPRKRRSLPKALSGTIIVLGLGLLKLKTFLIFAIEKARVLMVNPFEGFGAIQYAVAGGSMLVTVATYAATYPNLLGVVVGFVVITFIHETGHAVVIRAKGLRAGYMVFLPFIGGAVTLKDQPRTAYDDAQIGLAGPVAGTLASLVSLQLFKWSGNDLYLLIAVSGFFLNLVNLLPIGLLDGGRISAAITKWMWLFGGAALLWKVIDQPNPLMIAILILAAFQVYASIVREREDKAYFVVTGPQRAAIAVSYFTLVVFLGHQLYMGLKRITLLT